MLQHSIVHWQNKIFHFGSTFSIQPAESQSPFKWINGGIVTVASGGWKVIPFTVSAWVARWVHVVQQVEFQVVQVPPRTERATRRSSKMWCIQIPWVELLNGFVNNWKVWLSCNNLWRKFNNLCPFFRVQCYFKTRPWNKFACCWWIVAQSRGTWVRTLVRRLRLSNMWNVRNPSKKGNHRCMAQASLDAIFFWFF